MNFLDITNDVLVRLREPKTSTVRTQKNVIENMVKALINDAYKYVWAAHQWTATQKSWEIITQPKQDTYDLDSTEHGARISGVLNSNGWWLDQVSQELLVRRRMMNQNKGEANAYAVVATPNSAAVSVQFLPAPPDDKTLTYKVVGHTGVKPLEYDDDVVVLPYNSVMYYAYALAARERGEVGGQAVQEIFNMANQYLSDAIALDANYASFEQVWEAV